MKTVIITLAIASLLIVGSIITGFPSPAQKQQAAQMKIQKAQLSLYDAESTAKEVTQNAQMDEKLKTEIMEAEMTINDNEVRIADLELKIPNSGIFHDDFYGKKIATLEMKNAMLRKRISMNETKQSNWEKMKRAFNQNINKLGVAANDFVVDNWK